MANIGVRHPGLAGAEVYRTQLAEQQKCGSCKPPTDLIIPEIQVKVSEVVQTPRITDWASI